MDRMKKGIHGQQQRNPFSGANLLAEYSQHHMHYPSWFIE